ncbi:MAG: Hsp33 family molecular chaperone HslO [Rhodocyclaceae bacterium]|nr:Hsp33 family molecular chaperone HslO [Rhodocyclaceae bacterium]
MSDSFQRFIFEKLDIRGAFVQLESSWQAMQHGRAYARPVLELLGQTTAVTALIGSQLKTPGRLTFQLQGEGPVSMLVVDCDRTPHERVAAPAGAKSRHVEAGHEGGSTQELLRLRGMAKAAPLLTKSGTADLIGNGRLLLTLQTDDNLKPYQSFVPLEGNSIAAIFENYLALSEQQPTRLFLFADGERACGLFLQKLPETPGRHEQDEDGWNRVQQLAATVRADEFSLPAAELVHRLFAEEDVRLFEPHPVAYHCPRDEEKVKGALLSLGRDEVQAIFEENGEVRVQDDICNHEYVFGEEILEELFPTQPRRLH